MYTTYIQVGTTHVVLSVYITSHNLLTPVQSVILASIKPDLPPIITQALRHGDEFLSNQQDVAWRRWQLTMWLYSLGYNVTDCLGRWGPVGVMLDLCVAEPIDPRGPFSRHPGGHHGHMPPTPRPPVGASNVSRRKDVSTRPQKIDPTLLFFSPLCCPVFWTRSAFSPFHPVKDFSTFTWISVSHALTLAPVQKRYGHIQGLNSTAYTIEANYSIIKMGSTVTRPWYIWEYFWLAMCFSFCPWQELLRLTYRPTSIFES